ncbi:carbonyl reductase [NADPH] 1 isoform X2 [Nilaparvata lugens]|uniref:carbonyl reductase [NADPH] 1 isoform X2 n=1 Tax=Nilaparvata lugens TaxID=108931 RepID=UPI00193E70B1|nr:carbonyl reductase [NADPH] 1 isoform X2 [Nilaparvata lugens]
MSKTMERVAVITGGNKGIGFSIVKGLCKIFKGKVYLTARNEELGRQAVEKLKEVGYNPEFYQLDITVAQSRDNFAKYLKETYGGLDVLVNNAGIAFKVASRAPFSQQATETVETNFYGTLRLCEVLFPLLRPHARVVNLSSSCGHLSKIPEGPQREKFADKNLTIEGLIKIVENFKSAAAEGKSEEKGFGCSAYNVSKVAVSALTFIQQKLLLNDPRPGIIVNCVHPGYVDTDMTSHKGPLTPDEGAEASIMLATLPENASRPKGDYVWYDGKIYDWNSPTPTPIQ